MSKTLFAIALLTLSVCANAQSKKTTAAPAKQSIHLKTFNIAITSGDVVSAITSLNYYVAENGSENNYADTLAILYMQQGAIEQSYYWANKRLEKKPDDNNLPELKGIAIYRMQEPKQANNK